MHDKQVRILGTSQLSCAADHHLAPAGTRISGHDNRRCRLFGHSAASEQLLTHRLGSSRHPGPGQLTGRPQVDSPEVLCQRPADLPGRVHRARGDPLAQRFRRQVDQHDLARAHELVRHARHAPHPGDPGRVVADRSQMRDIQRGDDVKPGAQDIGGILPPNQVINSVNSEPGPLDA